MAWDPRTVEYLQKLATERGVPFEVLAGPKGGPVPPEFLAAQEADQRETENLRRQDAYRHAASRFLNEAPPAAQQPINDNVRRYLERMQAAKAATVDPMDALARADKIREANDKSANINADTAQKNVTAGKLAIERDAAAAMQQTLSPEHQAALVKAGVPVTPATTYAQAKDFTDQFTKGQGVQVDWAKLALEKEKAETAKGAQGKDIEGKLRDQRKGESVVAATKEMSMALAKAKAAPQTGVGDQDIIYARVKMIDPGSVVREGEIKLSVSATPYLDQLLNLYKKATTGRVLPDKLRADMLASADAAYAAQLGKLKVVDDNYTALAARYGVDPRNVVLPIDAEESGGAPGAAPGSPPAGGKVRMVDPGGAAFDVDASEAAEAEAHGWKRR